MALYGVEDWTYVTWDYRGQHVVPRWVVHRDSDLGLFRNSVPKRARRLAIPEHAEDLMEILKCEGIEHIDVLMGWSMGVQVSV